MTEALPIRCPRCGREAPRPAPFCAGCGAPLVLGDDEVRPLAPRAAPYAGAAPPRRSGLDATVDLDRRGHARPAPAPPASPPSADEATRRVPPPRPPPPAARELPATERSHWKLGAPPAAALGGEPAIAKPPTAKPPTEKPATAKPPTAKPATAGIAVEAAPPPAPDEGLPDADVDALEVHVARAETWRRVAAWAVDALPFAVAGGLLAGSLVREAGAGRPAAAAELDVLLDLLAHERVIVLSVAAAVALALASYATIAHALAGATLGKRLLRLRVVGPDGAPPSPARSALRSALAVASAALLGLGFLLALFTRSGRSLHDLIARTWVVKAP